MSFGMIFFANPFWLWMLLVLPLGLALGEIFLRRRQKAFSQFAKPATWARIAPELDWGASRRKAFVFAGAFACIFLALARPQWGKHEETVRTTGMDIMLVLDVSRSMETEDAIPSRLKKMKHVVRALSDRLPGDRFGVVAFAGSAHLACPLTDDAGYMLQIVDGLSPNSVANQGTDIGTALETAARALDRGAEQSGGRDQAQSSIVPSRIVLLISDGEDFEDQIAAGVKQIRDGDLKLYVFGVGTEQGGPIPVRDENGSIVGYKHDREGKTVVSRFHPNDLKKLAADAGGKYWTLTQAEGEIDEFTNELSSLARGEREEKKVIVRDEHYQIPLGLGVFLLLLELGMAGRKMGAAFALAMILIAPGARPAQADESTSSVRSYMENQSGLKSFDKGDLSDAEKHFGSAQVDDPSLPEFRFNQGASMLKKGDSESAATAFGDAAKQAGEIGQPDIQAHALYDQAISLSQKEPSSAARSYLSAIEAGQAAHDPQLVAKARKNLELLFRQDQNQSKSGQNQDQDKDQKQDQKDQKQDSKDAKDSKDQQKNQQDQKKDQSHQDQDKDGQNKSGHYQDDSKPRPQDFKSQKFSKEDADRVLSQLTRNEKDLKDKMDRQHGRPQSLEKDW